MPRFQRDWSLVGLVIGLSEIIRIFKSFKFDNDEFLNIFGISWDNRKKGVEQGEVNKYNS